MDIKKRIKKLMPGKPWDIGMRENWLSAMAVEGLQLQGVDKYHAWFKVGEPADIRYRIDVPGEFFNAERSYKLTQSGWNHVAGHGCFNYYSSPAAENAPEIVVDAVTAIVLLNKQRKMQALKAALCIAAMLLSVFIWFVVASVEGTIYLGLTGYTVSLMLFYCLPFFSFLIRQALRSITDLITVTRIRAKYRESGSIDRTEPWVMKKNTGTRLLRLTGILVYFIVVGYLIIPGLLIASDVEPYVINNAPVVYLDTLEKDAVRIPDAEESQNEDTNLYHNYYWSALAPFQLWTDDSGEFQKGENRYESSMNTDSYQLRFTWLSGKILSDLMTTSIYTESDAVEVKHPGLDKLFIRKEAERTQVYAAKNKSVIRLTYWGPAEDEAIIDAVVQTIEMLDSYRLENKTNEKFGWLWRFYN